MSEHESPESNDSIQRTHPVPTWLSIVIGVFAVLIIFLGISQLRINQQLAALRQETGQHLQTLTSTSDGLQSQVTDLQGDLQAATAKLGLTEKQLEQARATARRLRNEQQEAAQQLNAQLQAQQSQLAEVSGNVSAVKDEVAQTQGNLNETKTRLERVAGDLGVQSGLVAHNREELAELRRRGERDYFEFNLTRSKEFSRVGAISVRVRRVDPKRNKYTATLLVNDKVIEKKDKTLLEPVQFYLPGTHHMLEVVVFEMGKDRIGGYLSAPKELALTHSPGL